GRTRRSRKFGPASELPLWRTAAFFRQAAPATQLSQSGRLRLPWLSGRAGHRGASFGECPKNRGVAGIFWKPVWLVAQPPSSQPADADPFALARPRCRADGGYAARRSQWRGPRAYARLPAHRRLSHPGGGRTESGHSRFRAALGSAPSAGTGVARNRAYHRPMRAVRADN